MSENNKHNFTALDWIAIFLLIAGIVGFVCLPFLVTQMNWLNECNINFGKPNEIGDMIGGIVGPFVGFISAALVYLALRAQIEANSIINKQIKKEGEARTENETKAHSLLLLNKVELFFNNFIFNINNTNFHGNDAITEILRLYFFRYLRLGYTPGSSGDYILNHSYDLYFNLTLLKSISDEIIKNIKQTYNLREVFFEFSAITNKYLSSKIFQKDNNYGVLTEYKIMTKEDLKFLECCYEIWNNHSIIHEKYTENETIFKDHKFNIPSKEELTLIKEKIKIYKETLLY